jgi:hypothetical protein
MNASGKSPKPASVAVVIHRLTSPGASLALPVGSDFSEAERREVGRKVERARLALYARLEALHGADSPFRYPSIAQLDETYRTAQREAENRILVRRALPLLSDDFGPADLAVDDADRQWAAENLSPDGVWNPDESTPFDLEFTTLSPWDWGFVEYGDDYASLGREVEAAR